MKCVCWFTLQLYLKYFSFWDEMREVWPKTYIGLHVKYWLFLSDFNETWIFEYFEYFRKILTYEISLQSAQWGDTFFRADERTYSHDEANSSFSQFLRKRLKTRPKFYLSAHFHRHFRVGLLAMPLDYKIYGFWGNTALPSFFSESKIHFTISTPAIFSETCTEMFEVLTVVMAT
jgi:hypothetical protein